jgi:hypothetical protein
MEVTGATHVLRSHCEGFLKARRAPRRVVR